MDDGLYLRALRARWDEAFAMVDGWLSTVAGDVERLNSRARSLYPFRNAKDGWRVPITFGTAIRRIDILVNSKFPFQPPYLALVDRPPHLTWPHIESDGVLCLLPSAAATSATEPIALITNLLAAAVNLIEESEAGRNADDFRAEFLSYWPSDPDTPLVRSLLEPYGPSRTIVVHRRKGLYFLAENSPALTSWLDHAFPLKGMKGWEINKALMVWLDQPMLPAEYPNTTADVVSLVRSAGLGLELDRLGAEQLQRIVVTIGAPTMNGPVLAAIVLKPKASKQTRPGGRSLDSIEQGFRPGHVPAPLLVQRFLATMHPAKAGVERIDAQWIHGRDHDPELPRLRNAKVVVIGCGSLGGPLALGLAQAGVGSLDLIDPEVLKAANVGRHPLGTSEVGMSKATALAARIRADYPHIRRSEGFLEGWEEAATRDANLLSQADLVISTIGEWAPEAALNAWRHNQQSRPDMLFGWTEPHAVAGHLVALVRSKGCLACGLSDWGEPLLPVADWPNGTGQRGEPACGVLYQPYGPVEIAHVAALVTEAAIDSLLGRIIKPTHRVWVAQEVILQRAGGNWSKAWRANVEGEPKGARIEERSWAPRTDCPICGGGG